MAATFSALHIRAQKAGLHLWKTGGYYRMSGLIDSKHHQGIFTSLNAVKKGIEATERQRKKGL